MPSFEEGLALYDAGQAQEAEAVFRAFVRGSTYRLGLCLLAQGRYAEGWAGWDQRPSRLQTIERLPFPEWMGGSLDGRSLLVVGEQGIGDELMFARFIRHLQALSPSRIAFVCHEVNVRAFLHLGADMVAPRETTLGALGNPDLWVMLGSLPARLGVTLESLPRAPYLRSSPKPSGRIGLVARGNPLHPEDAHRSMPTELLAEAFPSGVLLEPAGDVQDSLDLVAGLDHLITVDTSWAHMAGALGKPVALLLSARGCDWRWGLTGETTPWYPSATLYRQERPGDWASVLAQIS